LTDKPDHPVLCQSAAKESSRTILIDRILTLQTSKPGDLSASRRIARSCRTASFIRQRRIMTANRTTPLPFGGAAGWLASFRGQLGGERSRAAPMRPKLDSNAVRWVWSRLHRVAGPIRVRVPHVLTVHELGQEAGDLDRYRDSCVGHWANRCAPASAFSHE
jgi:hypothetical protein